MPASIKKEANDVYRLTISGTLLKSELEKVQNVAASEIDAGAQPQILVSLEDFQGFEAGESWGELGFLSEHVNDIAKIAIVGDPRWEAKALAFAGANHRRAPVKFFAGMEEAQARAWLAA